MRTPIDTLPLFNPQRLNRRLAQNGEPDGPLGGDIVRHGEAKAFDN
jgi:hypothetical protein